MKRVLRFVRTTLDEAPPPTEEGYSAGFRDALSLVEEYILDSMWDRGEDDEEA